jgi:transcription elongation factor Elf1
MRVNRADGRCRECGGSLDIVDVSDATLTVQCDECGESYEVEPDAFGDGCMLYHVEMMAQKQERGDDS